MEYGVIGEHLTHSFSKEIHEAFAPYTYEVREIPAAELYRFMEEKAFTGINVTIPYKERVIPHLYHMDEAAARIGAVNTVVNRDGRLFGFNTDFFGMTELIAHAGITVKGKKVAVLGTGGTSKTACAVCRALGAGVILPVSRRTVPGAVTYDELQNHHRDTDILLNTTPAGMFPRIEDTPLSLNSFPHLSGVIDAIYNPLRSRLVIEARNRNIPAEGGLYMLVAQAVRASEIFTGQTYDPGQIETVYRRMMREKENIVLVGMPSSGKSTVGELLAADGRRFLDTDKMVEAAEGRTIPAIFASDGEAAFRRMEAEAVRRASAETGAVIATGGGAILDPRNLDALRKNGRLYFLDRPLSDLLPTSDRPLSADRASLAARFHERYHLYVQAADCRIPVEGDPAAAAALIRKEFTS